MVANISQAISLLHVYLDQHFQNDFNILIFHADKIKYHESKKETGKQEYQLYMLRNLLAGNRHITQKGINKLFGALAKGTEHFQYQLVKAYLDYYKKPDQFKKIEDDIAKIAKELQEAPYNYHSADLINCLRVGILAQLHFELDQLYFSDQWVGLTSKFEPKFIIDAPECICEKYVLDLWEKWEFLYYKYCDEPNFSIYVLNLIHTLPYQ